MSLRSTLFTTFLAPFRQKRKPEMVGCTDGTFVTHRETHLYCENQVTEESNNRQNWWRILLPSSFIGTYATHGVTTWNAYDCLWTSVQVTVTARSRWVWNSCTLSKAGERRFITGCAPGSTWSTFLVFNARWVQFFQHSCLRVSPVHPVHNFPSPPFAKNGSQKW